MAATNTVAIALAMQAPLSSSHSISPFPRLAAPTALYQSIDATRVSRLSVPLREVCMLLT